MSNSFGPGGMPRARCQLFDDQLIPEEPTLAQVQPKYSPNFGQGYYPQQQPYRSSQSSSGIPRPSSSNSNRISSAMSATSSKLSFFSGFKKKNQDDFDKDDGELYDYPGSFDGDASATISMNQIGSLRDRDRYPSLASESPSMSGQNNTGRTMSLRSMSNFDTTPIIPTFTNTSNSSKSQAKMYRQSIANSHRQMLRGNGYPMPPPSNANLQQPYSSLDKPMPNGSVDSARARSASSLGYHYQQPHPSEFAGRAMSMGGNGYVRGPPPVNGNGRPMARRSFPNQYGTNVPNPINSSGRPSINNQPPPMHQSSQGPSYGINPGYVMRSRSISSKSNSPNSSSNIMSRPNSGQTLSSTADEMLDQKPASGHSIVKTEINDSVGAINGAQLSSAPNKASPISDLVNTTTSSAQKTDEKSHSSAECADSTDSSSSCYEEELLEDSSNVTSVSSKSKTTSESFLKQDKAANENLVKRNIALLDEVRLVTSELADSIRCELGIPDSVEIDPSTTDLTIDNLMMSRQERVSLIISFQDKLDVERRQRLVAEEILQAAYNNSTFKPAYDAIELERRAALSEQKLQNALQENSIMAKELKQLRKKLSKLDAGSDKSEESSDSEELSEEAETTTKPETKPVAVKRKPISSVENIEAIESQRDALREALRSLRERKDHELKLSTERIRQLEEKLEKEKREYVTQGTVGYRPLSGGSDGSTSPLDPPFTSMQTPFQKRDYSPVPAEWTPVGFNPYPNLRKSATMSPNMSLPQDHDEQLSLPLNTPLKSFN